MDRAAFPALELARRAARSRCSHAEAGSGLCCRLAHSSDILLVLSSCPPSWASGLRAVGVAGRGWGCTKCWVPSSTPAFSRTLLWVGMNPHRWLQGGRRQGRKRPEAASSTVGPGGNISIQPAVISAPQHAAWLHHPALEHWGLPASYLKKFVGWERLQTS